MSQPSAIQGFTDLFPAGRIKNYLETLQLRSRRKTPFRIRFDFFRNYWKIQYEDCEFTFVRNPTDRFMQDISTLRKMPAWVPDIIIDANPGQGTTGILLARNHPESTVYMFEPEQDDYHVMMENVYHNQLSNILVVPGHHSHLGAFLLNEIAGHFFDKSIVLKLHLPDCSQDMISIIAGIWRNNHLRVILTTESSDTLSYSYDLIGKSCSEEGMPWIHNRHDKYMPVFINERNLMG